MHISLNLYTSYNIDHSSLSHTVCLTSSSQLNASKMEILWCSSVRRQSQLPSDLLAVGSDLILPVRCVHDLGIFIDADLTMRTQVTQTCSVFCRSSTTTKHMSISVKRHDAVAHYGAGVFQA